MKQQLAYLVIVIIAVLLATQVAPAQAGSVTYYFNNSLDGWSVLCQSPPQASCHRFTTFWYISAPTSLRLQWYEETYDRLYISIATSPNQSKAAGEIPRATIPVYLWRPFVDFYIYTRFQTTAGVDVCSYTTPNLRYSEGRLTYQYECPGLSSQTAWRLQITSNAPNGSSNYLYYAIDDVVLESVPGPTPTPTATPTVTPTPTNTATPAATATPTPPMGAGQVLITAQVTDRLVLSVSGTADFGTGLTPSGSPSSRPDVDVYTAPPDGAYYVRHGVVQVSVFSNTPWSGNAWASENSGNGGMSIAAGSLRWSGAAIQSAGQAAAAPAFTTTPSPAAFEAGCCTDGPGQPGHCWYSFDYALRVLWTDAPGVFQVTVTYQVTA